MSPPSRRIESRLDLKQSGRFGAVAGLNVMCQVVGARSDDRTESGQAAVASFTRFGFEAAAITYFGIRQSRRALPPETGGERVATLRFAHPYAVVAIAGRPGNAAETPLAGLPPFTAWIADPAETEDDHAT